MAYAASTTYETSYVAGVLYITATVVETGITSATDEFTIEISKRGTMHLHICTLTAGDGTATTIDPDLFEISSTTATARRVWRKNGAAASTRATPTDAHFYTVDGKLRGHSGANGHTGTTGFVTTIIHFVVDSTT